jgi:hypothetical protein
MPQPQSDNGLVDPGPQELDGTSVTQHMGGEFAATEARTGLCGRGCMLGQEVLDGVPAEWAAPVGDEHRVDRLALRSLSQACRAATAGAVKGVTRSFRPFP